MTDEPLDLSFEAHLREEKNIKDKATRQFWILIGVIAGVLLLITGFIVFYLFQGNALKTVDEFISSNTSNLVLIALGAAAALTWFLEKRSKVKAAKISKDKKAMSPAIKLDPLSPALGEVFRWIVFITFHSIAGYAVWLFLDNQVYAPLGREGFIFNAVEVASWLVLAASIWSSFDANSIPLFHKGELLWFGKPISSNITHGFFCLGLPRWLGPELRLVNAQLIQIIFGVMNGKKREDFVLEGKGFFVIFDMAFSVKASNTRIVLNLEDDPEKLLVTRMNGVVSRFLNMPDESGKPRFETIDSLKTATAILSHEILHEKPDFDSLNKGETARELFAQIGFELVSVDIKDVQNADKSVINARQSLEARRLREEEERLSAENIHTKIKQLYDSTIQSAGLTNLSEEQRLKIWNECKATIERDEGKRTTFEGLGRSVAVVDPTKSNKP